MQNRLSRPTLATPGVSFLFFLLTVIFPASPALAQTYSVEMLGALGGDYSEAVSINEAGQVAGNVSISPGGAPALPFRYANGVMTPLPSNFGGNFIQAHGINNLGQVAGQATLPGNTAQHAFLWSGE